MVSSSSGEAALWRPLKNLSWRSPTRWRMIILSVLAAHAFTVGVVFSDDSGMLLLSPFNASVNDINRWSWFNSLDVSLRQNSIRLLDHLWINYLLPQHQCLLSTRYIMIVLDIITTFYQLQHKIIQFSPIHILFPVETLKWVCLNQSRIKRLKCIWCPFQHTGLQW